MGSVQTEWLAVAAIMRARTGFWVPSLLWHTLWVWWFLMPPLIRGPAVFGTRILTLTPPHGAPRAECTQHSCWREIESASEWRREIRNDASPSAFCARSRISAAQWTFTKQRRAGWDIRCELLSQWHRRFNGQRVRTLHRQAVHLTCRHAASRLLIAWLYWQHWFPVLFFRFAHLAMPLNLVKRALVVQPNVLKFFLGNVSSLTKNVYTIPALSNKKVVPSSNAHHNQRQLKQRNITKLHP